MSYIPMNNFVAVKTQSTAQTTQQAGSSTAGSASVVNGTSISYTPDSNASKVVYECAYYCERDQWITNVQIVSLEESTDGGSTWSEINAKYRKNYGYGGNAMQSQRWYQHLLYFLPAWSGSRDFRVTVGISAGNRQTYFHKLNLWDGAATSTEFTTVNVMMYSIV